MDIVLCTDNNYVMPTGVLMCSVCENNQAVAFHVVLGEDTTEENIQKLRGICSKYSAKLSLYRLDYSSLDFVPFGRDGQPGHVSVVTYFRLFLAQLLPESLDRVLYLDGDIICLKSLQQLWDLDLCDYPIAAAIDMDANDPDRYNRLGYSYSKGYYNAGVLLVNLKYWREKSSLDVFKSFIETYPERIIFHDQDVLNYVFAGKILPLDIRYNLQSGFLEQKPSYIPDRSNFEEYIRDPYLVHYTTNIKPWIKGCSHPYASHFLYYYHCSPWCNERLALKRVNTLRGHLINVLVRLGLHTYNGDYINL